MSNPIPPPGDPDPLDANGLTSGEYAYANSVPVTGHFSLTEPEPEAAPVAEEPAMPDASADAPEEVAETVEEAVEEAAAGDETAVADATEAVEELTQEPEAMPEAMADEAFTSLAPPVPDDFVASPWADLSFLSTPGPMHEPSLELAEATQPPPASAVSPSAGSSPDVHPTEMPQTPVSPGVAETTGSEAQDVVNEASPVNVEAPAPSAIETPPAPVASPAAPVAGEPNMAVGEMPSGAAVPDGATGTAPIHPEPQAPAAVDMQIQMSENMADHFASVLHDVLQSQPPD